ncbi:28165_t:CDS:1, partial [Dentiscutata erythropus]
TIESSRRKEELCIALRENKEINDLVFYIDSLLISGKLEPCKAGYSLVQLNSKRKIVKEIIDKMNK